MDAHLPQLPDELWLQILTHLPYHVLWTTIRAVHPKLRTEAEKLTTIHLLPTFTLALPFTLGSGSRHRWYDVRATITLSFSSIDKHNQDFALFAVTGVHPPNYTERALERWRPMCVQGVGAGLEWQVSSERVTYGIKLEKIVSAEDGGLWCDWRELLNGWIRRQREIDAKDDSMPS